MTFSNPDERRLRWLGHVIRMDHQCIPGQALHWEVPGFKRGPGRPCTNWMSTVNKDLLRLRITWHKHQNGVEVWPNASTWMRVESRSTQGHLDESEALSAVATLMFERFTRTWLWPRSLEVCQGIGSEPVGPITGSASSHRCSVAFVDSVGITGRQMQLRGRSTTDRQPGGTHRPTSRHLSIPSAVTVAEGRPICWQHQDKKHYYFRPIYL